MDIISARRPLLPQGHGPFLAALPHMLLMLTVLLPAATAARAELDVLRTLVNALLLLLLLGLFVIGWRRDWPLWSGSAVGYWLLFLLFTPSSYLKPFQETLDFLLPLLLLPVLLLLFQPRPRHGVLAIMPLLLITRIFDLELLAGREWLWATAYLILALASACIVAGGTLRRAAWLALLAQLLVGLAFALGRSFLPYHGPPGVAPSPQPLPDLPRLLAAFLPSTLAASATILVFLVLHLLWQRMRRNGRSGRPGYLLLLLGALLVFFGRPADGELALPVFIPFNLPSDLTFLFLFSGLLLSLVGTGIMMAVAPVDSRYRRFTLLLALLVASAPLVAVALPPPLAPDGQYSVRFQTQLLLAYAAVLGWIVLALLSLPGPGTTRDGLRSEPAAVAPSSR